MFRISSTIFAAAVIIAAGVTPMAPASPALADPKPEIALCRDILIPALPASNLGECLSYITVAENESQGDESHHCDWLQENDPTTFDSLFVTKSECIQAFGLRGHFN